MEFVCDKCGICCQSLKGAELYKDLDDGTGVCRYFDKTTKLCTIYDHRPEKCNVKDMYKYAADRYSYDEYVQLNIKSCEELRRNFDNPSDEDSTHDAAR